MKQMEATKKEYINKIKQELDQVEEKWIHINDENIMTGEDYRSQAHRMTFMLQDLNKQIDDLNMQLTAQQSEIEGLQLQLSEKTEQYENEQHFSEELRHCIAKQEEATHSVEQTVVSLNGQIGVKDGEIQTLNTYID